jgi:dihydrodipicolinate synthase/N-acetylneuraminate lyase
MITGSQIVVPALALRASDGPRLDAESTSRYAQRAARTWADAFILSGSTTRGDLLTVDERAELLDLWLRLVPASRLVACCWCQDDLREATRRAITPMVVMHSSRDDDEALSLFACLPRGAYVYSHPKYDSRVLDAALTATARRRGVLPAGAKLSKVTTGDITEIRCAAGSRWTLWDASGRHVDASLAAGASGVVVSALSHFPTPFPERSLSILQSTIDTVQAQLDRLPTREARSRRLHELASEDSTRRAV